MSGENVIPFRRPQGIVDPEHVQWALGQLFDAGIVIEVRCPSAMFKGGNPKYDHGVIAGFFNNAVALVDQLRRIGEAKAVYFTLNPVLPALFARAANVLKMASGKKNELGATTNDDNIARRRWLLVDVDAIRLSNVSSTEQEHDESIAKAKAIAEWLTGRGWPTPLVADSGNGGHLLYRIDLPNDDPSRDLVQKALAALGATFDSPAEDQERARNGHEVQPTPSTIDTTVYNASRICKLYGTMVCKGDSIPDRPHRMSRMISVPEGKAQIVSLEQIEALAALAPGEAPKPQRKASGATAGGTSSGASFQGSTFDVGQWVESKLSGLVGEDRSWKGGGRRWVFDVCPFNAEHGRGEAWVGEMPSGAVAAGCHHDSCRWGWAELREMFDPAHMRKREAKAAKERRPMAWGFMPQERAIVLWLAGYAQKMGADAVERARDALDQEADEAFCEALALVEQGYGAAPKPPSMSQALQKRIKRRLDGSVTTTPTQSDEWAVVIDRLVRRPVLHRATYNLTVSNMGKTAEIKRLTGGELLNYRVVRDRAIEAGVMLPQGGKTTARDWAATLEAALDDVEVLPMQAEESPVLAIQEEVRRLINKAERGETADDLRRGWVVPADDGVYVLADYIVRKIRITMQDDRPTREDIIDAVDALRMVPRRPKMENGERPRVWVFPLALLEDANNGDE